MIIARAAVPWMSPTTTLSRMPASTSTLCKRFFSALPSSPGSAFFTDCNGPIQGISVGWSDEYPYTLADQYLVLNPGGQYIGDGEYCLFSVADPSSRGEVLAALFLIAYAGLAIPVLAIGLGIALLPADVALLVFSTLILILVNTAVLRMLKANK